MLNNRFLQSDMIARCKKQLKIIASLSSKESKKKKHHFLTLSNLLGGGEKSLNASVFLGVFRMPPKTALGETAAEKKTLSMISCSKQGFSTSFMCIDSETEPTFRLRVPALKDIHKYNHQIQNASCSIQIV